MRIGKKSVARGDSRRGSVDADKLDLPSGKDMRAFKKYRCAFYAGIKDRDRPTLANEGVLQVKSDCARDQRRRWVRTVGRPSASPIYSDGCSGRSSTWRQMNQHSDGGAKTPQLCVRSTCLTIFALLFGQEPDNTRHRRRPRINGGKFCNSGAHSDKSSARTSAGPAVLEPQK